MNRHMRRASGLRGPVAPAANRPSAHAHKLVLETAQAMAHEIYDELMSKNDWYARWKAKWPGASSPELEAKFVAKATPDLLEQARKSLAGLLRTNLAPEAKDQIAEALVLDASLVRGRG